jgi:hypothetical protein
VLWPEILGNLDYEKVTAHSVVSDGKFPDEMIFSKIRWFVVVRPGDDSALCL